jgi:hypothetical protein
MTKMHAAARSMLTAHITSFLKLIATQLEEASRGVTIAHHLHNVQCGIENILSLLERNEDVVDKADQLSRRASKYSTGSPDRTGIHGDELSRLLVLGGQHRSVVRCGPMSRCGIRY